MTLRCRHRPLMEFEREILHYVQDDSQGATRGSWRSRPRTLVGAGSTSFWRRAAMYQDYIMRMVQQFSGFLIRVLRLREEGQTEEALALLADGYGKLVGLPASLVHALSEDDLIALLRAQGRLDPERCLGLAELLREEGHTYDDVERYDESFPRYLKALRLYLEIVGEDEDLAEAKIPGLDDVIEQLSGLDLPVATAERLVAYLEEAGRFDEAENV